MPEPSTTFWNVCRHIPNAISLSRLLMALLLVPAIFLGRPDIFQWLLLACLLSDVLDGLIARSFQITSELGSSLDSVADVATMAAGLLGVYVFQRYFVLQHYGEFLLVITLYGVEVIASLWRYGTVSSFHTILDRVAAVMAGVFVMSLFLWGYKNWLFQAPVVLYTAALGEELILIYLLPEWKSNVGGVYRVFRAKTE